MSKPNVRDQWFYRIIEIHRKFCTIDNVTSFIEKRDFNTILLFVSSVNKIIELDTSQQSHVDVGNKIVGTLSELVDVNEREFSSKYPDLYDIYLEMIDDPSIVNVDRYDDRDRLDDCYNFLEQHEFYINQFMRCYDFYEDRNIIPPRPIANEFNNYLAHLSFCCYADNCHPDEGIGHLNRGVLDGYKKLIIYNKEKWIKSLDLRAEYAEIRIKESFLVGATFNAKMDLGVIYEGFAEKVA